MLRKFLSFSVVIIFPMCHAYFQALSRGDFYKKRLTSILAEQKTSIEDLPSILVDIQDEARDYLSILLFRTCKWQTIELKNFIAS